MACPVGDTSCGQWVRSYNNWGDQAIWMSKEDAASFYATRGGKKVKNKMTKKVRRNRQRKSRRN